MTCSGSCPARHTNLQAPRTMLKKSLENSLRITVRCEKKTISSKMRNSSNRSREDARFRIPKRTLITPNCQLIGGDTHPSWVTYTSQEPSGDESPYAYGNYKVPKPSIHTEICRVSRCGPKDSIQHFSRGSQLPPSTP